MSVQSPWSNKRSPLLRRKKGVLRVLFLAVASATIAALAASYSTVRDYGSFRASILTGSSGGAYYSLASNLAKLARLDGGRLEVVSTAGSIENARRLTADREQCVEKFGFVQDGTPVSTDSGLELLGRLPGPEYFSFWCGADALLPASSICAVPPSE